MCKLGYIWQPMITSDHHNLEVTKIREIIIENEKYHYTIRERWINRSWSYWPKMKDDGSCGGKSSKQKYANIFKGGLVLLGTSPRPKKKGEESKPDQIKDYLLPPRGEQGRQGIEL